MTISRRRLIASGFAASAALALGGAFATSPAFSADAVSHGEFTPLADAGSPFSRVHFFPKRGNKLFINGALETIPPGVGVSSGGLIGVYNNASIDKVPGRTLAPFTVYFVYGFMASGVMTMDFSTVGHMEDPTFGHQVHVTDPTRSLIGMVRTDAQGKFIGSAQSQMTISWFNMGHTGLICRLDMLATSSTTLVEVNSNKRLEWLQWGINNTFRQGFTVPNIHLGGTVVNNTVGRYVHIGIGINGSGNVAHIGSHYQSDPSDASTIDTVVIGANGTDEGYHYASFLMSNGGHGGVATMASGALYSSPFFS